MAAEGHRQAGGQRDVWLVAQIVLALSVAGALAFLLLLLLYRPAAEANGAAPALQNEDVSPPEGDGPRTPQVASRKINLPAA